MKRMASRAALAEGLRAEESALKGREACAVLALRERPACAAALACLHETEARQRLLWRTRVTHRVQASAGGRRKRS